MSGLEKLFNLLQILYSTNSKNNVSAIETRQHLLVPGGNKIYYFILFLK